MQFASSIVVPTDFSKKSKIAIRYACEIASHTGGEVHFLNVIEEPYDFPSRVQEILNAQKQEQEEKLSDIIRDLHKVDEFRIIKMKGVVKTGKVLSTTRQVAREHDHDMIVIGLGGEADFKKVLYGSITNNLLMTSEIPVLAISKHIDYRELKTMLFATDMRKPDINYIKKMREFCLDIGVSLKLIHIAKNVHEIETEKLARFNKKIKKITNNSAAEVIVHQGPSFTEGITDYIGKDNHTVLVMTRYKNKFWEWFLSNSTVKSIAQMASVPLLMLPADV
ncbi:universal stress protein [Rhodohalobacter sp. 8-1]|uniref:universal stress protein n=1 Tax=Rhodohalobacter sp. 8-1 TaxID=3131972 RepID=UPI0030EE3B49